jgi:nucleoid-associated protein YgaU
MQRLGALFCGFWLLVGGARAEDSSDQPSDKPSEAPLSAAKTKTTDHYRVRIYQENGDCLWRIAEKVYGDRSKWRLIYLANRDKIQDPNKIYPHMTLTIPPPDWQPETP